MSGPKPRNDAAFHDGGSGSFGESGLDADGQPLRRSGTTREPSPAAQCAIQSIIQYQRLKVHALCLVPNSGCSQKQPKALPRCELFAV